MTALHRPFLLIALLATLVLLPTTVTADSAASLLRQANAVEWSRLDDTKVVERHLDLYVRAAQAAPGNVEARVKAAEFAFYAWRLETDTSRRMQLARTGLQLAREAVALDDESAAAWYWSGSHLSLIGLTQGVLESLHLIPEARSALERVMELDESYRDGQAVANLARMFAVAPGFPMSIGNTRRAKRMLLEGYERYPDSTYFPLFLADLAWAEKDTDTALAYLEEVLEKEVGSSDYTAVVNPINQEKAREMAELIEAGTERDRFNDVLSD